MTKRSVEQVLRDDIARADAEVKALEGRRARAKEAHTAAGDHLLTVEQQLLAAKQARERAGAALAAYLPLPLIDSPAPVPIAEGQVAIDELAG